VHQLFSRIRDKLTDGTRVRRLLEADCGAAASPFRQFPLPVLPEPDRARERRSEPRFSAQGSCEVAIATADNARALCGEVCDLSRSGLAVLLPCALAAGSQVTVRTARLIIFGTVLHSRPATNGQFRTGIRLREVCEAAERPQGA
jgi:hypothetical protein